MDKNEKRISKNRLNSYVTGSLVCQLVECLLLVLLSVVLSFATKSLGCATDSNAVTATVDEQSERFLVQFLIVLEQTKSEVLRHSRLLELAGGEVLFCLARDKRVEICGQVGEVRLFVCLSSNCLFARHSQCNAMQCNESISLFATRPALRTDCVTKQVLRNQTHYSQQQQQKPNDDITGYARV